MTLGHNFGILRERVRGKLRLHKSANAMKREIASNSTVTFVEYVRLIGRLRDFCTAVIVYRLYGNEPAISAGLFFGPSLIRTA